MFKIDFISDFIEYDDSDDDGVASMAVCFFGVVNWWWYVFGS